MSWKYYRKGKLKAECNDITPDTVEDAVKELRENGVDVSDCIVDNGAYIDDCWSPDYPPEEDEYNDKLIGYDWGLVNKIEERVTKLEYNEYALTHTVGRDDLPFAPLTDKEVEEWEKVYQILEKEGKTLKVGDDFMDKVWNKAKPSRLTRFKRWCNKWTDKEVSYLIFWIITIYVMIGVIRYEPRMIEIILWPFM